METRLTKCVLELSASIFAKKKHTHIQTNKQTNKNKKKTKKTTTTKKFLFVILNVAKDLKFLF